MATTSEARALPFFTDLYGQPLESGSIYIGQAGLDPVAYPAVVTSDLAGSVAVAQPIRTTHGHAAAAGALIHLFTPIPYSITILDSAGRVVYASLSETDPILTAFTTSSVQSVPDLPTLRARVGSSTNQVWVAGNGMYIFDPTDHISPESLPDVVVGSDGSRYKLSTQYAFGFYLKVFSASNPVSQGAYFSWNDLGDGAAVLTDNQGSGAGGFVFRTVNLGATIELGRVTFSPVGGIVAGGDVRSAGNLIAQGGIVSLLSDGSRALSWDAVNSRYTLPGAPLSVNGSLAITQATLQAAILANQQANGVGAVALGTSSAVSPVLPGTWVQTGTASNSVFLWVRTA
jgi:hypothetical protein